MPTTKKRINITLPVEIDQFLTQSAKKDGIPVATKAVELLKFALEVYEDGYWEKLANKRMNEKNIKYYSHKEVWGE